MLLQTFNGVDFLADEKGIQSNTYTVSCVASFIHLFAIRKMHVYFSLYI